MSSATSEADGRTLARDIIGRFVMQLAREMRSSLHTVLGFAELMQGPACTPTDARVYAAELARATDELRLRILRTLMAFQDELERTRVDAESDGSHGAFEPLDAALAKTRGAVT